MSMKSDNPIDGSADDKLQRDRVAASVAQSIRVVDASRDYVMGVLGPWGSGKTSLINMVRERLADDPAFPVIDFNPWLFSGADQPMESFFAELAAQLRLRDKKFQKIAEGLGTYSALLAPLAPIPFICAWADRTKGAGESLKAFAEARKESVGERRAKLEKLLVKLDVPIVVVIDDIDRLTTSEIREIFKLVRLTARFPNLVYLLAFDRERVEAALSEDHFSGRDYLEKIIQSAIDIPNLPQRLLMTTFGDSVQESIDSTGVATRFDEDRWPDVLAEIIWPLIDSMRDVRRYASSIDAAIRELQDEIELVDILALEAVRVFMPDTFVALHETKTMLTGTRDTFGRSDDSRERAQAEALLSVAEDEGYQPVARALIERLFPAAQRYLGGSAYGSDWEGIWLKGRRVAHRDLLTRYLERITGEGMDAFLGAERLFMVLSDRAALETEIGKIAPAALEDAIAALESFQQEYPPDSLLPATIVLFNTLQQIPDRERDMWQLVDARLVVTRVVLRLLRRLQSPDEVQAVVDQALPEITSLSSRLQLITLVGRREGAGHKLISETRSSELEKELADQVIAAPTRSLTTESDLLRLLYAAHRSGVAIADKVSTSGSPELTRAMLLSARAEARSQSLGSRTVHREVRLQWQILETLFGSADALRDAIDSSRSLATTDSEFEDVLQLADRYLDG